MDNINTSKKIVNKDNKVLNNLKVLNKWHYILFRYSNNININSDPLRWGTWYWWLDYINRYKNYDDDLKIWWRKLSKIKTNFKKSFIIDWESDKEDFIKSVTFSKFVDDNKKFNTLFNDTECELLRDIEHIKDDDKLEDFANNLIDEPKKLNTILQSNFYPIKTMLADNILRKALDRNNYDSFIRKDHHWKVIEVYIPGKD